MSSDIRNDVSSTEVQPGPPAHLPPAVQEAQELQQVFEATDAKTQQIKAYAKAAAEPPCGESLGEEEKKGGEMIQWSYLGADRFTACGVTKQLLPPGFYSINKSNSIGLYFQKIHVKTEGLIRFPQLNSDKVIEEIQKFWTLQDKFMENGLSYKRGILLWGPPGSGKSSTVQFLLNDVVARGGIALDFVAPSYFKDGFMMIRTIQPDTPIVVLMEDLDEIIRCHEESEILNILDGMVKLHKVVFLATTNFPEKLGARIINRPSRFDKRFKIGHPNAESRRLYIEHLFREKGEKVDFDKWVEDTEGFSFAHIRELYVSTTIIGDTYSDSIQTLAAMKQSPSADESESFDKVSIGFGDRIRKATIG